MSQTFWQEGTAEEEQTGQQPHDPPAESLALSVDDFSALEERILRAVELVKRERQARVEADERAARSDEQMREQMAVADKLEREIGTLRAERDQVRQRVERLLAQLDALEL
ncbi:MAG: hypothetical protein ACRD3N_08180 [Terracidiphilus sp.]